MSVLKVLCAGQRWNILTNPMLQKTAKEEKWRSLTCPVPYTTMKGPQLLARCWKMFLVLTEAAELCTAV